MKKLVLVCTGLALLSCLAFAVTPSPKFNSVEEELKAIQQFITAQKELGHEISPALAARIEELSPSNHYNIGSLDQGGGTCGTSLAVSGASLPYSDSGVLDATDDRAGRPFNDVFYTFTSVVAGLHTFAACGSAGDTYLRIWTAGTCGVGANLTSDDVCTGDDPSVSVNLTLGQVVVLEFGLYTANAGGNTYTLTITGPQPPPVNDPCSGAISVAIPSSTNGTTVGSTLEVPAVTTCDQGLTAQTAGGVWYTVVGNDHQITAELCATSPGWDSRLTVFTGTCGSFSCEVGNDDACGVLSRVNWCAHAGVTYYILVHGFGGNVAPFRLDVIDGPICVNPVGRCCYTDGHDIEHPLCTDHITAGDCEAIYGGTWANGLTCDDPCPIPFVCHCGEAPNSFCNTVGGPINDVSENDFPILVGPEYHITDVNVCLSLIHTFDGDLIITLESPSGTKDTLSNRRGSSGDNFDCTTFDDEASVAIAAGIAPFQGSFIPDQPLSVFDGENAGGTWILHISDNANIDVGTLLNACLSFEYDRILAVELAGFTAVAGNNSVTLNWSTASEVNNSRFDILRDGETVGSINGAGTTSDAHSYTWTDTRANNGTIYSYSLVSVDVNNVRDVLGTVNGTPSFNAGQVTDYALAQNFPNPFNPSTDIVYDMKDAGRVSIRVYNLMGQLVATLVNGEVAQGRHMVNFDAKNLTSGVYVYRMEAGSFVSEHKMLLMK